MSYGRMYTFLQWKKENGDLRKEKGYRMSDPLQEMDGGAAAPMATPTNTPGMGNAAAASADSEGTEPIGETKKKKKINEDKALPQGTYIDDDPDSKFGFTVGRREYGNGPGSDFMKTLAKDYDGPTTNETYAKRFKYNLNEGRVTRFKFMDIEEIKPGLYEIKMKLESSGFAGAPDNKAAEELTNNKRPKKLLPEIMHGINRINNKFGKATNIVIDGPNRIPSNVDDITFRVTAKFN